MIISQNRSPSLNEFSILVNNATKLLNHRAKSESAYFIKRNAQLLEKDVFLALTACASKTNFQDTIRIVSGQKFPDIVAGKYYGVEVKTSKDDKWISLGGSVNESTRVDGVERIYLTFGKLLEPVEFKSRPYEDCLSEVVATHYPRYKIDMNLDNGNTIFDKMKISYDELRGTGNAVGEIIKYYKSKLKPGESLWWIDGSDSNEENVSASMKVRLWSSLSKTDKNLLTISVIVFFPEIFGDFPKKYERAALWLASRHGVVSTSMRDSFSAGGKVTIVTKNSIFEDVPQIFGHINDFAADIRLIINSIGENILCEMWKTPTLDSDRLFQWVNLVSKNCNLKNCDSTLCWEILEEIFRDYP